MFNKSKRKIVFAIVGSLFILLAVTLITIYVSNNLSIQKENKEMLQQYVDRYSIEINNNPQNEDKQGWNNNAPIMPPDNNGRNEPAFRLSTFYSVAYEKDGEVLAINNGNNTLLSESELLEIAETALKKNKENGKIDNYTYLVADKGDYTLVALIDGTINDNNQRKLLWQMMAIGGSALVVLFVISIFIARLIVKPIEENDKKQKQFISDAGHELKTPIAVISANSEILKREIGDNEWLSNINYENDRMAGLVQQLLTLSRMGKSDIQKEQLDLSQLVTGEVLPFETLAFEKGKKIDAKIEPEVSFNGNSNQLCQLVSILLDNAISHGIGEDIELVLKKEKHNIVLSVINEANEITDEQINHLFDRFYRTDEARNETGLHYGLGLSIAKAIVDSHNGSISATYSEGKITISAVFSNK